MLTDDNFHDLEVKGYTVVKDVLTTTECDDAVGEYREWLTQFQDGDWPESHHSLVFLYNIGNLASSWSVRLKSKNVFAQIWKTDKLLTSVDAVAIGRPPEEGVESFHVPGNQWLHVDQSYYKAGLHAYQGAVYLEEACEDDWTFEVLEGSHAHFDELFKDDIDARESSYEYNLYHLTQENIATMEQHNCATKRVPAPKGGMVIWDSRLVHANARPLQGRNNPGRWRFVVLVSMTPAIWADKYDIREHQRAYTSAFGTSHWSSQGIALNEFDEKFLPPIHQHIMCPTSLPEVAQSDEAKQLSGVLQYDFDDGQPTGIEKKPTWRKQDAVYKVQQQDILVPEFVKEK